MPLILSGLGTLGLRLVRTAAGGVNATSAQRRGMHVGAVPVDGGRWLG